MSKCNRRLGRTSKKLAGQGELMLTTKRGTAIDETHLHCTATASTCQDCPRDLAKGNRDSENTKAAEYRQHSTAQ